MENSGKRKINIFFVNIVNSTLTFTNVADAISPKNKNHSMKLGD